MTVREYIDSTGSNPSRFARECGIPRSAAYGYYEDGRVPRGKNLQKMIAASGGKITAEDALGIERPRPSPRPRRAA